MNKFLPTFVCALLIAITAHAEDVQFVSTGKFPVGRPDFSATLEDGNPIPDSLYGTSCEIMMGTRIQKNATARVHALHPDLTQHPVKIKVERSPNTSIVVVRVISEDGIYAQAMADAVMDEFLALRREIKSDGFEAQALPLQDEIVRREKDIERVKSRLTEMERAKVEPAELDKVNARLKHHNKRHEALIARLEDLEETKEFTPDFFTIIEHASEAEKVEKAP